MNQKDLDPTIDTIDPALEQLEADLERMGAMSRPAMAAHRDAQIIGAIREHTPGAIHRIPRPIFRRPRPLASLVAVALSIVLIVGATYAAVPALTRVFDLGGASTVIDQNLGKAVHISQSVAGYTMTIKRVYADANRILIAYSIVPPVTGHRQWDLTAGNLTLADSSGATLPERGEVGYVGTSQPDTTLQWFDAAGIAGNPKELHLRLTVPWIDGMEQLHAPPRSQTPSSGGSTREAERIPGLPTTGAYGSTAVAKPIGEQDPWMEDIRVYGPLSFDLTIPFVGGFQLTPHEQATTGGVSATLDRVVISPTETRFYVSGLDPNVYADLSGDGWDANGAYATSWRSNGVVTVFSFLTSLMDKHGEWTLVVKPMPALHLPKGLQPPPGSAPAKGGPWTFQFQAP